MSVNDPRPAVWVGHVVLESDRLEATAQFMRTIGMRTIFPGPRVAVFELRGGTHLVVIEKDKVAAGVAPFDLMVEDLQATHREFTALGLEPTPIESAANMPHELFRVREPAGHLITFYSNHVSDKPV
jgi:catechol 2,3-dioxygenase-like lactoylglutathione lyase family enzyme